MKYLITKTINQQSETIERGLDYRHAVMTLREYNALEHCKINCIVSPIIDRYLTTNLPSFVTDHNGVVTIYSIEPDHSFEYNINLN